MKLAVLLLTSLIFLASPAHAQQKQLVDRVIAVINDEAITQSELDVYLRPFYEDLKKQYEGDALMSEFNEIRLKLLNQMIEDRLVFQESKVRGVTIDEAEIDEKVEELKKRFPSSVEFEKALAAQGTTLNAVRENVRRQLSVKRLHDMEIRAQVIISPHQINEYYNAHPKELAGEEKIKIRSVTVRKTEEAAKKGITDEAAKAKIESVSAKIRAGEAFDSLAREVSEDNNAKEGGQVGWVKRGELLPQIEENIFELPANSISPVLETPEAYHLFRIEEKTTGVVPPLEEVRDKIHGLLYREKAEKKFKEWMEQLKAKAYISVR